MIGTRYELIGDRVVTRKAEAGQLYGVTTLRSDSHLGLSPEHSWWQLSASGKSVESTYRGQLRFVDFFSSVGGLSLGAATAGEAVSLKAVVEAAIDIDSEALTVHRENFGTRLTKHLSVSDIVDFLVYDEGANASLAYAPEIIDPDLENLVGSIDLVLAGPPCQGHSNLNNHTRRSDPRNQLYLSAAAAAIAFDPQVVVFENVPAIARDKSNIVETAEALFRTSGYIVSNFNLRASDLGAPQSRHRHFLIASKQPHVSEHLLKEALSQEPMTLWSAIGDLENSMDTGFMTEIPKLSQENIDRIDYLFEHNEFELPNNWRPDCHKDGHTYPSVYGRLSWDKPSPTITTGFMTPGRGRYVHPTQRRVITPREAARLQGFPDTFSFAPGGIAPSRKSLSKWIGDAVPVQLGYAAVLGALTALPKPDGYGD